MADIDLVIDFPLPPLPGGAPAFPHLAHAVAQVAAAAHRQWLAYAQGQRLPDGQTITPRSGAYLKSIQLRQLDGTHWEIFSDAPYAAAIEFGTPQRDLKEILQTSKRVRRSKAGKRYLIIPFRYGTGTGQGISFGSQVMPQVVHALAKGMAPSRVTGMGWRESGNYPGQFVPQAKYQWGGRLSFAELQHAGLDNTQARRFAGMVKFQQPGTTKHSQYLTFRVMSEDSKGWIRPAQPGKYPAKQSVEVFRPVAEKIFSAALQKDVDGILGG